eukprot:TRINITY_DN776_c0_g1_i10.p1 TRINITY_DN776_c0_g1~~TRINITY_DN776_c0_g1_i10.p1  ORF type:complete len:712 (+),score=181.08 TRINITY_DN776_c0_g1_i10:303-2438(+)
MEEQGIELERLDKKADEARKLSIAQVAPSAIVDPLPPANEEAAGEDESDASFHYMTLKFVHSEMEYDYEQYYWTRLREKFRMYSGLMVGLFAIYTAVLISLTKENSANVNVLIFHLVVVFFPMCVMLVFGNNTYLPHQLALVLNCSVFVLSTVGAILSVGLFYYSHVNHPIVYAGLFFVTGCVMPNFHIPFIHGFLVNMVIFGLYIAARFLSEEKFEDEIAAFSVIMFFFATVLNILIARDSEIQMRLEFLYARKISFENQKLRNKVWNLEGSKPEKAVVGNVNLDLESPIEKAVAVLNDLIGRSSENDAKNLQQVLDVITQHQNMLKPDLEKQLEAGENVDTEIQNWLFYELAQKETKKGLSHNDSWSALKGKPQSEGGRRTSALNIFRDITPEDELALETVVTQKHPWNWDVFELNRITKSRPLYFVGMYLFKKYEFATKFKIDEQKMSNFFTAVEEGYGKKIPYHNNMHAADVLLSVNYLMTNGPISRNISDIELFGALLAACVHDYNHPGLNNAFQISTLSSKALIYNDRSVLENYHISASWMLMKKPQNDMLSGLTDAERKTVRKLIIEMILSTDMAVHFDTVGDLKSKLMAGKNDLNLEDPRIKDLLMRVALKVADIGHTAKNRALHEKWTDRVQNEFYNQGDEEKRLGIPISPFMDRENSNIPKSQVGFINFVVLPLFDAFNYSKSFDNLIDQLKDNQKFWEDK